MIRVILIIFLTLISASAANLLPNSSFSSGDLNGWAFAGATFAVKTPLYFTNIAGTNVLRLEHCATNLNPNQVCSGPVLLQPSTAYTLSIYARADPGHTVTDVLQCYPVNTDQARLGQPFDTYVTGDSSFFLTTNWARYSFTFVSHTNANACLYNIYILSHWTCINGGAPNQFIYVQRPQLEEGVTATAWQPTDPVEVGANLDRTTPGHVFYSTGTPALPFTAYNSTSGAATNTIFYDIRDLWGASKATGSFTVTTTAGQCVTNSVTLPTLPLGHFRFCYWQTNSANLLKEVEFSIIPPPVTVAAHTNGFFGSHLYNEPWFLGSAQRIGLHWTRMMSVERQGFWTEVEPTDGGPILIDTNRIALARTYSIEPMINLGSPSSTNRGPGVAVPNIPDWATNSTTFWPATNKWYSFASSFYSLTAPTSATYEEIWNEQVDDAVGTYDDVLSWANLARAGQRVAIVAPANYYMQSNRTVISRIGATNLDFISTHLYNYDPDTNDYVWQFTVTNNIFGLPMWQTEAGLKTEPISRATTLWQFSFPEGASGEWPDGTGFTREARYRSVEATHMMWYALRPPFTHWFYYDARTTTGFDHPVEYSINDYNMTMRPWGTMMAAAAQHVDSPASLKGRVLLSPKVSGFWWTEGSTPSMLLFATNNDAVPTPLGGDGGGGGTSLQPLLVSTLLPTNQFTVTDPYGNVVPYASPGIQLGLDALYITANGVATNTFLGSFAFTPTTDTIAPLLQITRYPLTNCLTPFLWGWQAQDNCSLDVLWNGTNNGTALTLNTNAIQYRSYISPTESSYGPWTNTSWRLATVSWTNGAILWVQAKDAAGNITTASVTNGATPYVPPTPPTGTNPPIVIQGNVRLRGAVNLRVTL